MKCKNKIGAILLSICLMTTMFGMRTQAASGSMSISNASGNVGDTVTVSCTVKCQTGAIGSATVVISYNPAALQYIGGTGASGGGGSVVCSMYTTNSNTSLLSTSIQFKILAAGSHSLSGSVRDAFDFDESPMAVGGASGTITGKAQTTNPPSGGGTTTSNNNKPSTNKPDNKPDTSNPADNKDQNSKLNNLQVSPGTLAPAFSADTTSYTVEVPESTKEVTIAATAQSSKATVTVTGGKDLKPGENEAKVVVMSEGGATTVYNIKILCGEEEKIQIDGKEYKINESFTDEQIPTGFAREKVTYNEKEYGALKHEKGKLYLVNLQNDEAGAKFYIYDQKTQEFYNYAQVDFQNGRYIIPLWLDNTKEFKQCEMITLTLQDKQFDAWKIDEEYSVIRVMNHDGEITFYQYDNLDGTLQRYAKPVDKTVEEEEEKSEIFSFLEKYHLYMIAGLGAAVLVLIVILICLLATRKDNHQARRRKYERKLEKEKGE